MRRPQIGKLGKQIAMGWDLGLRHLAVGEDSQESAASVIGECSAVGKASGARGIIRQYFRQQHRGGPLRLVRLISSCMLESVRENGKEAAVVHRLAREVGVPVLAGEEDGLCRQRTAIDLD